MTLSQHFILNQVKTSPVWASDRTGTESDSSKNSKEAASADAKDSDKDSRQEKLETRTISEPEKGVAALPWPEIVKDSTRTPCQALKMRLDPLISEKNRSPLFISQKLIEHKKELQDCYHRFLKIDPNLKGKVLIRLNINCMGLVKEAKIVNSDLAHNKLESNLLEIIHTWNDFGLAPETLGDRVYLQVYEFGLETPKTTAK